MSKIHSNQSFNCLLMEEEKYQPKIKTIQRHSFIIHKHLMIPLKTWKTIIQQKKEALIVFDDVIAGNETLSPTVTELFLRGRKFNISLALISRSLFSKCLKL